MRFVSTPEILERIIRIEREILQIESSTQSNDIPIADDAGHSVEGIEACPLLKKKCICRDTCGGIILFEYT